jgi:hypothetical protein
MLHSVEFLTPMKLISRDESVASSFHCVPKATHGDLHPSLTESAGDFLIHRSIVELASSVITTLMWSRPSSMATPSILRFSMPQMARPSSYHLYFAVSRHYLQCISPRFYRTARKNYKPWPWFKKTPPCSPSELRQRTLLSSLSMQLLHFWLFSLLYHGII